MKFDKDELKNLKEGIVPRKNHDLDKLKRELGTSSIDERIKSLTAQNIGQVSEYMKKRAQDKLEVVFIFDKSGSCEGLEAQTTAGFNGVIEAEIESDRNDIITTVLFSDSASTVHNRQQVNTVNHFSYQAWGGTALYDTLCSQIKATEIAQQHDDIKPKKTIFIIMTDGYDNQSYKNSESDTKRIIKAKEEQGWEFIFLGAMEEAKDIAERLGIPADHAEHYISGEIDGNFESVKLLLDSMHEIGEIEKNWSEPINERKRLSNGNQKRLGSGRKRLF